MPTNIKESGVESFIVSRLVNVGGYELGRQKFLDRGQGEIAKRGIVDVLRKGVQAYPAKFEFFYQTPFEKNVTAKERFGQNIFSVTS